MSSQEKRTNNLYSRENFNSFPKLNCIKELNSANRRTFQQNITKMPNKIKQTSHHKSSNNIENDIRKLCVNPLNLFKKQQLCQQSIEKKQLRQRNEQNELLKAQITCQEANLVDLQRKLDDKTEKLNEIKGKYDELRQRHQKFMKSLEDQYEQYSHLEVAYDKDRLKLNDKINRLNQDVSSLTTFVNAKEAECAANVKDMRAKLEDSNTKNAELEQELFKIKEKNLQLENECEISKMKKENLLKNFEKIAGKMQKKIDKKNDRISELVGKLKNIETENTELKDSLKIQENKINQLQCVLNRPVITAAPMQATADNNNQRETEHNNDEIIPTASINPFGSSSRSSSPRSNRDAIQEQLADPSFGNPSAANSSGQRECSQSGCQNLREVINGSAQLHVEQNIPSNIDEPQQKTQRKRRRPIASDEESGDDIVFTPYNPKQRR